MKIFSYIGAVLMGALLWVAAFSAVRAADLFNVSTSATTYAFQGLWVSADVGGAFADAGAGSQLFAWSGFYGGAKTGYDFNYSGFVFGPMAGVNFEALHSGSSLAGVQDVGWEAGARVGYAFGNLLIYAPIAWQHQHVGINGTGANLWADGVLYGAALEAKLTTNFALRFEGDFVNYNAYTAVHKGVTENEARPMLGAVWRFN